MRRGPRSDKPKLVHARVVLIVRWIVEQHMAVAARRERPLIEAVLNRTVRVGVAMRVDRATRADGEQPVMPGVQVAGREHDAGAVVEEGAVRRVRRGQGFGDELDAIVHTAGRTI